MNSSGLGIDLNNTINISSIFFADDIIIIGKSNNALHTLMNITRTFFKNHKLELSEKKSKLISHSAATGQITFKGTQASNLTLEEVLTCKYLGVPLSCTPHNLLSKFNEQVKTRSEAYLTQVLSLVKTGPDRAELAHTLWTCVALPSILYATEVLPLTQATISEVQKCQSVVGKFILQLPRSSASVAACIDAGLKPVWSVIAEKVLLYNSKLMKKPADYWPRVALSTHMAMGNKSPYIRYLMKWKSSTNTSALLSPNLIRKAVNKAAIIDVLEQQKEHSTSTFAMNPPDSTSSNRWFKPKGWVSDSCRTKIISIFRACNAQLGNRGPTKDGRFFSLCPLCSRSGQDALNNEV